MEEIGNVQGRLDRLLGERFGLAMTPRVIERLEQAAQDISAGCALPSARAYVDSLKHLPLHAPLLQGLLRRATARESYFFRDRASMESLQSDVLPWLLRRAAPERRLRVWSAGCSTGEELYSVALLLQQMLPDYSSWEIQLVGTDIDARAVETARRAEYTARSLRATSEVERARYFDALPGGRGVRLRERWRGNAQFYVHNLLDGPHSLPVEGPFDLILCRDVLTELTDEAQRAVELTLRRALRPGGCWIAASKDPVARDLFFTTALPGLSCRVLGEPLESEAVSEPPVALAGCEEDAGGEPRTWRPPAPSRDEDEVTVTRSSVLRRSEYPTLSLEAALEAAGRLEREGERERALRVLQAAEEAYPLVACVHLARARIYLGAGRLLPAEEALRRALELNPSSADAHLRLGELLVRVGQNEGAQAAFRDAWILAEGATDEERELRARAERQLRAV